MGLNEWLERKNENLREMNQEIWLQAQGQSLPKYGNSWWSRNYIKVVWYGLLLTSLGVCYYLGWDLAFRVMGIIVILQLVGIIWQGIKKLYNILKTYFLAKKLLKQMFRLKKD